MRGADGGQVLLSHKSGEWKPLDPKAARPADVATTKTSEGKDFPLIVRQEKGVIKPVGLF